MLRKIAFLVSAFALAFLVSSRIGGLAGKIGADGLAWAQDSSPADDSSDDAVEPETSGIKFTGKGTIESTGANTSGVPFPITGSVTKTSIKGLASKTTPGDVSGDATIDSCTINQKAKTECCTFASAPTFTFSFSEGDLYVKVSGNACGKKVTKVTAKNASFDFMGGTGLFAGATGSGTATFTYNENSGAGKFSFKGNLTE